MSKIRILPEIISNKIAAGEVVERPASVVKELMENSLDAGSSRIAVEVEQGGRRLIRVSDDGGGMNRDDALLALERYATSKIRTDADLFSIKSLGFRGEALPSMAAVSRFTLVTREHDSAVGTEILVAGGKILKVVDTGVPPGTMVTVETLFFNTPARRKFMKTVTTEMGHIADVVNCIALGQPGVYFKLEHNGKTLKSWPPATDRLDRVADVLGEELRPDLCPVARQIDCGLHRRLGVVPAGLPQHFPGNISLCQRAVRARQGYSTRPVCRVSAAVGQRPVSRGRPFRHPAQRPG